jgi:mRNA interferase MazF
MNRGEVWWVNFDPSVGGEIQKARPAVIVSNDSSNQSLNRLQVVPVTSNVSKVFPWEALIELNSQPRKGVADQLTTASKIRFGRRMGQLSFEDMQRVEAAIRVQLDLS